MGRLDQLMSNLPNGMPGRDLWENGLVRIIGPELMLSSRRSTCGTWALGGTLQLR